jgi:hypothetical protein
MAIITESELEVKLNHVNNAAKGRTLGARNIPDNLRAVIGLQAHFDTAKNVAKSFDIAPITAHHAKESHGHSAARKKIDEKLAEVKDLALDKMLKSLGVIKDDKIEKLSVKGALAVAKTMADIVDKTTEKNQVVTPNQVLIYAPQIREDNDYSNVIEINR